MHSSSSSSTTTTTITSATSASASSSSAEADETRGATEAAAEAEPPAGAGEPQRTLHIEGEEVVYYAAPRGFQRASSESSTASSSSSSLSSGDIEPSRPPGRVRALAARLVGGAAAFARNAALLGLLAAVLLLRPLVVLGLRALVRSRAFWEDTLRKSYYDPSKVRRAVLGVESELNVLVSSS